MTAPKTTPRTDYFIDGLKLQVLNGEVTFDDTLVALTEFAGDFERELAQAHERAERLANWMDEEKQRAERAEHDITRLYDSLQGEMRGRLEAEAERDAAYERAAQVCDEFANKIAESDDFNAGAGVCAESVRALKRPPEPNADKSAAQGDYSELVKRLRAASRNAINHEILREAASALENAAPQTSPLTGTALSQASKPDLSVGAAPPFSNCKYKICDLPGQCIGEGKCHHPVAESMGAASLPEEPVEWVFSLSQKEPFVYKSDYDALRACAEALLRDAENMKELYEMTCKELRAQIADLRRRTNDEQRKA